MHCTERGRSVSDELNRIFAAHGGLEYWRSLKSLEVEMSVRGLLFKAKRVPPRKHVRLTISTGRPEVATHDYPAPGQAAGFYGEDRVEIRDASGEVLQARKKPREMFRRPRRLFYWDALDFAYFSSYAIWNYLTMPFLFLCPGVEVRESIGMGSGKLKKVTVRFPQGFPTHSEEQDFYFDRNWHLYRHDYIAEVVGGWAKAAHLCESYKQFSGLSLSTKRRIHPRLLFNKPLRLLTLVAIDIHNVIPCKA